MSGEIYWTCILLPLDWRRGFVMLEEEYIPYLTEGLAIEEVVKANPKEWKQMTKEKEKTFNFLFGQLMRRNPNLCLKGPEGAIALLKKRMEDF